MAYVPNMNDNTNPLDTVDASTAAAEFRALKVFENTITTVASATTPDIFGAASHTINYTGATVCTGFAAAANAGQRERVLICAGAAQFTTSGNLIIDGTPSGNTLIVAVGTVFIVIALSSTQFRMIQIYPIVVNTATYATTAGSASTAAAVTNGGALNTPASGNLSNCTAYPGAQVTGTVSSATNAINIVAGGTIAATATGGAGLVPNNAGHASTADNATTANTANTANTATNLSGGTVSATTISGSTITGSSTVRGNTSTSGGISSAVVGVASSSGTGVYGFSQVGTAVVGEVGDPTAYSFYATGGGTNYGPFTGGHDGLVTKDTELQPGDIVVDVSIINHANLSNCIALNALSATAADKRVVGVFNWAQDLQETDRPAALKDYANYEVLVANYRRISFNAVGEGQINVCKECGNIEAGDYIQSSSTPGKGMRQPDDIYRNYTVAKARESVTWGPNDNSIKQIACIYLCG